MLMFNWLKKWELLLRLYNLNTSHVNVQSTYHSASTSPAIYLNTSHVNVQLFKVRPEDNS